MHAMRVGVHSTMGSSPGNLVFNRDMFLNIPLIADWHAITLKREHLINENLMRENQKRRRYDYIPQQRVLKKTWKPQKLGMIFGRCAQIPAIFENLIPRPEEKKDIFTDTPVFDD